MRKMELLGKEYTAEAIAYIGENPGSTYGQIIYAVAKRKAAERTIYLRLEDLKDAGITDTSVAAVDGIVQKTATLTEYGQMVAGKLRELKETVGE